MPFFLFFFFTNTQVLSKGNRTRCYDLWSSYLSQLSLFLSRLSVNTNLYFSLEKIYSPPPWAAHTSFIPPVCFFLLCLLGRRFSGTLSLPQQLHPVPLLHNSHVSSRVFPSSVLAQMDGQRKKPMNQSERCGKEGGRDISSMLVAGAQAA